MTITPDEITKKRLLIVKQLYQNAVLQASSQHAVAKRIIALVGFSLSIETMLKAVFFSLDSSKIPSDSFNSLVQEVNERLGKNSGLTLPDIGNVKHVHNLRNDAQHDARPPSISELSDCRTYTRDFHRQVFQSVWDLDFETFTLVDIIRNTEVRDYLNMAEQALKQQ